MNSFKKTSLFKEAGCDPVDFYWAGLLMVSALSLYLRFPTRCYVLEGLARAIPIELGLFQRLLLGNYLLYGLIGDLFYHVFQAVGFSGHAYIALQVMDSLLGAGGLFIFYLILRTAGTDRFLSCAWTAVLGVSLGYWMWSTEAENYIFSTFLLQLNFLCLILNYKTRRLSPWFLGVMQALAIFGHLVNGLFGIVALWFFVSTYPGGWHRPFLKYATACAAVLAMGFGGALAALGVRDWPRARAWILGSAGGPGGKIRWHGSWWTLRGIHDWLRMSVRIVGSLSEGAYLHPPAWRGCGLFLWAAFFFLIVHLIGGISRRKALGKDPKTILAACGLWFALYAVIFLSWEPNTMVYRISDLVPFVTALALISQTIPSRFGARLGAALIAVCLGIGNFGAEIRPRSFWENNPTWRFMQFLKSSTEESAWVAGNEGVDNIYIPYFAERRPLVVNPYRDRPDQLKTLMGRIWSAHQNVYVTSQVLSDPFWKDFFSRYSLAPRSSDPSGRFLYLVQK